MSKRGSGSSARAGGGGGAGAGAKEKELFTVGKDGVRTYDDSQKEPGKEWMLSKHSTEAMKAFRSLSDVHCVWNKGFDVLEGDKKPVGMKRSQQWDYLKNHNINSFILRVPEGQTKRALKQMEDYGYHVVAKLASNSKISEFLMITSFICPKRKCSGLDWISRWRPTGKKDGKDKGLEG